MPGDGRLADPIKSGRCCPINAGSFSALFTALGYPTAGRATPWLARLRWRRVASYAEKGFVETTAGPTGPPSILGPPGEWRKPAVHGDNVHTGGGE